MATAQTIIDRARYKLADATDASLETATALSFLNEGMMEFAALTQCLLTSGSISPSGSLSSWVLTTTLDADLLNVHKVRYNGLPLDFVPLSEVQVAWPIAAGTPTKWTMWGETLYLDRTPATGVSTLSVYYSKLPALVVIGDTLVIQRPWEPALCAYVCGAALDAKRDVAVAGRFWARYEALRAQCASIMQSKIMAGGFA